MTLTDALAVALDVVERAFSPPDRRRVRLSAAGLRVAPHGGHWRGRATYPTDGLAFVLWDMSAPMAAVGNWREELLEESA